MPRRPLHSPLFLLPLLAAACSPHAKQKLDPSGPRGAHSPSTPPAVGADAGLEVTTFISSVSQRELAAALVRYADQPLPISHELEDLWGAHGLRMVSLPIEDAPGLIAALQSGGGSQRQWLGQAYAWTEAARGNEFGSGRVVALDAERIRLSSGTLRLLVRSWIEPVPPEPRVGVVSGSGDGASRNDLPSAILRVEMVPQHREANPDTSRQNPLAINEPKIDAESQGLLFSRLYARMSVPAGRAVLILAERPGADWRRISQQPDQSAAPEAAAASEATSVTGPANSDNPWPKRSSSSPAAASSVAPTDEWAKVRATNSETVVTPPEPPAPKLAKIAKSAPQPVTGAPRIGEVIRGPLAPPEPTRVSATPPNAEPDSGPTESGPSQSRVPTLGEAMLNQTPPVEDSRTGVRSFASPQRTVVLLIPHVPREFHLLGPTPSPAPARSGASSPRE